MIKKLVKNFSKQDGWSFMETLIVIAIILILTATVGIMGIANLEKSRLAGVQVQIESFVTALDAYYIDTGMYPTSEQGLKALRVMPQTSPAPKNWGGTIYCKRSTKRSMGK